MEPGRMVRWVLLWTALLATAQGEHKFDKYNSLEDIKEFFKKLSKENQDVIKFVPSIATGVKTPDNNDIFAVHITSASGIKPDENKKNEDNDEQKQKELKPAVVKPKIYIQCLIHAREWISGSVCQFFAKFLVDSYSIWKSMMAKKGSGQPYKLTDKLMEVKEWLDRVEFVIVPVVNPDGYEWSRTKFRLWRRNRGTRKDRCTGVDLNRNFPYGWKETPIKIKNLSSGKMVCNQAYSGPSPMSEVETRAIANYFMKIRPVIGAIDFHSYAQTVIFPYENTQRMDDFQKAAEVTARAMSNVDNKHYTAISGRTYVFRKRGTREPSTGTFRNWASAPYRGNIMNGKPYRVTAITVELRETDFGFELPEDQIIPTCKEAAVGAMAFTKHVYANPIEIKQQALGKKGKKSQQKYNN